MSVFSYRGEDGVYLYHGFRSNGLLESSRGGCRTMGGAGNLGVEPYVTGPGSELASGISALDDGSFRFMQQSGRDGEDPSPGEVIHYLPAE